MFTLAEEAREVIRHLAAAAAARPLVLPRHTPRIPRKPWSMLVFEALEGLLTMIFVPDSVATVEASEAAHRKACASSNGRDPEKGDDAATPSIVSWRATSNPARRAMPLCGVG